MAAKPRKTQADVVGAFARRLRDIRVQRGLSQTRLARKSGVNLSYLNKLERAEATPGLDLIARLADGLGVPLSELVAEGEPAKEALPALREMATENFGRAVGKAGRQELLMLSLLGSLLDSAMSRNR